MSSAPLAPREAKKMVVEIGDSGKIEMPSFPSSWKESGPFKTVISIHLKKIENTTKVSLCEMNKENGHVEKPVADEKKVEEAPRAMAIRAFSGGIGGCKKAIASRNLGSTAPKRKISMRIQSLMRPYNGNHSVSDNYFAPIPADAFSGLSSVNVKGMAKEYEEKIKAMETIDENIFQRNNWSRIAFKERKKEFEKDKELVFVRF